MSIFGDMDTEEVEKISDNPWSVPDSWYHVFIEKAWESEKDGNSYANFTFKIDMPERGEHGMPIRDRFQVFPNVKSFKDLDSDEQRQLKRLKKFLIQGCDLTHEEAAKVSYEELIGTELFVKSRTTKKDDREFTNIVDHLCMRLVDERNISTDEASKSVGL